MASFDDVRELAFAMPEVQERLMHGWATWRVREKMFVWERPLGKKDRAALSDIGPDTPVLGARVEHELAKRVLIENDPEVFFTVPHFDGFPAVLIRLERIGYEDLEEVVIEAWLDRAPKRLADAWVRAHAAEGLGLDHLG